MGLFKQDLNTILVGFQRTIQKLDRLATRNNDVMRFNDEVAANLRRENNSLEEERDRAIMVRDKLLGLVG